MVAIETPPGCGRGNNPEIITGKKWFDHFHSIQQFVKRCERSKVRYLAKVSAT